MSNDKETRKACILAVMCDAHNVIRTAMSDLRESLTNGDIRAFKNKWEELKRFETLHATMEEGRGSDSSPTGFFRLLESKSEDVPVNNLCMQHEDLMTLANLVDGDCVASDLEALRTSYVQFAIANLEHLESEESTLSLAKIQELPEGTVKELMIQEVLAAVVDLPDFEFFVKFFNRTLEQHHCTSSNGEPRAELFNRGLQALARPEQWSVWKEWIEESLAEDAYNDIDQNMNCDSAIYA